MNRRKGLGQPTVGKPRQLLQTHTRPPLQLAREELPLARTSLGEDHATTIGLQFQFAQALYKTHFFGREGYRSTLISSIKILGGLVGISRRVLGDDHPLTRRIAAGFLMCFEEQLDWSLDDIPDDYLEYRALLLEGGCAAARRRGVR